jgi:hypothetical protein
MFRMYWVFEKDVTSYRYLHVCSQVKSLCEIIWVICFVYCKLTKLLIRGHTKLKEKMTFHYCVQLLAVQQKMKVKPFQDCCHMCTLTVGAFYFHVPY